MIKYAIYHPPLSGDLFTTSRSNISHAAEYKSRSEAIKANPDRHIVLFRKLSKEEKAWFDPCFVFGEWTTIEDFGLSSEKLPCRCSCGAIGSVLLRNLKAGASTRCKGCADKARAGRPTIGLARQTNAERGLTARNKRKANRCRKNEKLRNKNEETQLDGITEISATASATIG